MSVLVPIGDFSRMTHLSVKALRFYHDQGLLEPARIDPQTGYRYYDPGQVPLAQVIRRFRDLACRWARSGRSCGPRPRTCRRGTRRSSPT
jgi:hypothetical protein